MKEIISNLFIGSDLDCRHANNHFAVIHACKTCHQSGVGYCGNLSSSHPNYLIYEDNEHLYLNMVDMDRELLPRFTHPIMKSAITFIEKYIDEWQILIHCNQGQSRSPSIGMVYLARMNIITTTSYSEAKNEFILVYPNFLPGRGIELYLMKNWDELMEL